MREGERLTTWVKAHPWRWAFFSGVAICLWCVGLFGLGVALAWIFPGAIVFGAINGYVWRPNGPGPRWNAELRRRYPPKK